MNTFRTKRQVSHSAKNMYAVVADIAHYPDFLPLCESLVIKSREQEGSKTILTADMTVGYKMINETFTSRVTLDPGNLKILVEYLDGPFSHLENIWLFKGDKKFSSEVDFYISYQFRSRMLQMLMGSMFDKAFRKFAVDFERQADRVYG